MDISSVKALRANNRAHLCDLVESVNYDPSKLKRDLERVLPAGAAEDCMHVLARMPAVEMRCSKPQLKAAPDASADVADAEGLEQYSILLTLKRKGLASVRQKGSKAGGQRARVYAPRCAPYFALCASLHTCEMLWIFSAQLNEIGAGFPRLWKRAGLLCWRMQPQANCLP